MFIKGKMIHKRYICIIMAVVLVISAVFVGKITSNAASYRIGTIYGLIDSTLNFREGPGTNYKAIAWLNNGQNGEILDEGKASNGATWYKMNVGGIVGWAHSDYVKVTVYSSDDDFETYLTKQGFPESYKESLRKLHAMYPNWEFEAQQVNLTWDEVIAAESSLSPVRSLVSKSSKSSWKSVDSSVYDWTTGQWAGRDGGSWTVASKEIVQYYVDPRNFLDDVYIFQFLKQSYDSTINYAPGLTTLFSKSTFWSTPFEENGESKTYVQTLVEVGAAEGVSPFTIASTLIQEKGWEPSGIMVDGSRGVYNYYNAGAYEEGSMSPSERGVWYAQQTDASTLRPWTTRTLAIRGGTKNYANNYIGVGQDTIYLKKFDVVSQGGLYNHQYMTNIQGAASEGKLLADAFQTPEMREWTKNSSLKFKIPVYKNMPSTASKQPTSNEHPNQLLKSLGVVGYSLTPAFYMYDGQYSLNVANNVTSVSVSATALAGTTTVSGSGVHQLREGLNTIHVTTSAQGIGSKTYTISVTRAASSTTPPSTGTQGYSHAQVLSTLKLVNSGNNLTGFTVGENVSTVISKINALDSSISVVVKNAKGTQITSGVIATGMTISITTSGTTVDYSVVIRGDVNGDGKQSAVDYVILRNYLDKKYTLSGAYLSSADPSRDGKVSALDYVVLRNHLDNKGTIVQ